ncbi:MAG: BamA/TamA family outer membrane protein [Flavobacteriales bacterium]|nr:BamA/TamA family outer membrane protein [Flavobacteriales bacterium]
MLSKTYIVLLILLLGPCSVLLMAQQDSITINVVQEIKIIGNKTTREAIILRELPFELGEKIPAGELPEKLARAKSNLLNTLLFNFVTVDPVYFDDKNISIYIMLEERWYWWPIPIFEIQETNFNTWWENRDLERLNYGMYVAKENFRGRKERLVFKFQAGYTEQAGVSYTIPYINKKQTQGMNFKLAYSRNHEFTYATTANKRDFYLDENKYVKQQYEASAGYTFRPRLYNNHTISVTFNRAAINDSAFAYNPDYFSGLKTKMQFLSLSYTIKRDKRNFKSYPTQGYYYDFGATKNGLGILDQALNKFYLTTQYRKYWQLADRFYFSAMIKGKYTIKEGPYYLYGGLGYVNNLVRGYELYVINGEHYALGKTQFRYAVMDSKVFKVNMLPSEKFSKIPLSIYAGTFFDAGYVDSRINSENNFLNNEYLYGGGLAIDFVSYYDIVFRMEYAINKLQEHGLYLHFVAPL